MGFYLTGINFLPTSGSCPDGTPSSVTCAEGNTCPRGLRDHTCVTGLCCPSKFNFVSPFRNIFLIILFKDCRRKAEDSNALPSVLGAYIPQCDPSGTYTPEQCQSSTGSCWCVTESGQEIPGTKINPGGVRRQSCSTERQRFTGYPQTGSGARGQCPQISGIGLCLNNCNSDEDCQNVSQKCCSNGCGRVCTKVSDQNIRGGPQIGIGGGSGGGGEKVGACPRTQTNPLGTVTGDECQIDTQCFGNQKCCQTSLGGRKCLTPDNVDFGQG